MMRALTTRRSVSRLAASSARPSGIRASASLTSYPWLPQSCTIPWKNTSGADDPGTFTFQNQRSNSSPCGNSMSALIQCEASLRRSTGTAASRISRSSCQACFFISYLRLLDGLFLLQPHRIHEQGHQRREVRHHRRELRWDGALQVEPKAVGETEQQRDERDAGRVARDEDDRCQRNPAAAGGDTLREQGDIPQRQERSGQPAQHAAQQQRPDPNFVGRNAACVEAGAVIPGSAQPQPEAGLEHQITDQDGGDQGDVYDQVLPAENPAEIGDVLDQRDIDLGNWHDLRAGKCTLDLEYLPQHVGGHTHREQVQADAGDEFIHLEHHREQNEHQRHKQGAKNGKQDAHRPGVKVIRAEHAKKRTAEHHAFHGDVKNAGIISQRAAQRSQQDGRGGGDHAVDQSKKDIHVVRSLILRRASSLAKKVSKVPRPATTISTMTACRTMINSFGTAVISSMPSEPVWSTAKKKPKMRVRMIPEFATMAIITPSQA